MYEENENKINWSDIIKKIIILIAAVLVIFGIILLINKCSKKEITEPTVETPVNLTAQIDLLEKATLEYLSAQNLPSEINASKTIRLKILISKNLIDNLYDSEGNKCDVNESYSEVTRLDNNYAVKVSVTCGTNKAYRVIYVGCFEECEGKICKGTETSTNGICTLTNSETEKEESKEEQKEEKETNTNKKPSNTSKPSTGNNSNNNNNNNNSNNNNSSNSKKTLYEYEKCTSKPVCTEGKLNENGECVKYKYVTVYADAIKTGGETKTTTTKVEAEKSVSTTTVYFTNSADAKNTSTVKYEFIKYEAGKGYMYKKYTTTYKNCSDGSKPVDGYCTVKKTTTTPVTYSCQEGYIYSNSTGKCAKVELQPVILKPSSETTCQVVWSYSTSLPGWTKTGRTK